MNAARSTAPIALVIALGIAGPAGCSSDDSATPTPSPDGGADVSASGGRGGAGGTAGSGGRGGTAGASTGGAGASTGGAGGNTGGAGGTMAGGAGGLREAGSDASDAGTSTDASDASVASDAADATSGSGLFLYYPFDTTAYTFADASGNGRDATAGSFTWIPGRTGNALKIDGTFGYVNLPTTGITDGLNDFTVSVWVNPTGLAGNFMRLWDFGTNGDNYIMVTPRAGGGLDRPIFSSKVFATDGSTGEQRLVSDVGTALALGTWQNVTVTQAGDTATMYINGVVVGSNAIDGGPGGGPITNRASLYSSTQNYLGKSQFPDPRFNGAYDDFKFYSRALSPDEVGVLSGLEAGTVDPTGLRVAYDFDQSNTLTVADSSGNVNDAGQDMSGNAGGLASTAGAVRQAVTLDGNQGFLRLPNAIASTLTDFTIAAWINNISNRNWARLFDFGNDTNTYMMLTPHSGDGNSGNKIRFSLKIAGVNNGNEQFFDGDTLALGSWQHVAVTRSGNLVIIYHNGVLVGAGSVTGTLPATTNNYIGRSQFPDPLLNASLDDFRIYNRALSAAEIAALAATPDGG